jgi:hypothetical protein
MAVAQSRVDQKIDGVTGFTIVSVQESGASRTKPLPTVPLEIDLEGMLDRVLAQAGARDVCGS